MNDLAEHGMTYQEKENLISLLSTSLISIPYLIYVFINYPGSSMVTNDAFHYWAMAIVYLIPISIIAQIVLHIIFSIVTTVITKEKESTACDERDKLIGLKATRNAYYTTGTGIFLSVVTLAFGAQPIVMFQVLICTLVVAEIMLYVSKVYYYKRGY